jgi:tetratricopeptide (TPR) repeat protein
MIVKNESQIISRALDSVLDIIDSWCIIDTGSTDDTINIIQKKLSHLPGEILSRPWLNFGHNRSEAFEEAKKWGDWILLIDADMILVNTSFDPTQLNPQLDAYQIIQKSTSLSYYNTRLLNSKSSWKCVGVTHEYFSLPNSKILQLNTLSINDIGDGGSKSDKFKRDIALLLEGLTEEPDNERYKFYLAQSYKDTGEFYKAIEWYTQRIAAGGWKEEVWYSHYMISKCYLNLDMIDEAEEWALLGYKYYPHRSEALYELCKAYRLRKNYKKAFEFYILGRAIPYPINDVLFISHNVYSHLFEYELTIIHYYLFPNNRIDGLNKTFNYLFKKFDQTVYTNSKFYLTNISQFASSMETLDIDLLSGFTNSSPCYLKMSTGEEVTNIRLVNYTIDRNNGAYLPNSQSVITKNYALGIGEMNETYGIPVYINSPVVGLEDIRLFEHHGETRFLAASKEVDPLNRYRIVTGTYNLQAKEIHVDRLLNSPVNSDCEKNWIPLNESTLIYSWYPFTTYSYPDLQLIETIDTPELFKVFRGSTAPVESNGLKWLVTHSVIYENPRTYLHYLVALNLENKPILFSLPFSFEGEAIEYCLSIQIKDDNITFYYSTWDSTSKKLTVPMSIFKDSISLLI